ncbi:hypothetical protein GCM10011390_24440 [Aureimonas endophytica]|uniref:Uncharacterized protein n=1 Tax=Aureimonas endophytica TaxID=2027858 RepID=A0A916ZNK6_9HYPH|nr:hypothetical protein [Aureimonas endophytica]GGE04579.1 hypothetical protein GCM10011390_24440 [Aureimonas endophytica]
MKSLVLALWLVHSWYPLECCSDQDCHPLAEAEKVDGGYRAEGIFYPSAIVKPSPDNRFHACYAPKTKKALCFFAPLAV